MKEHDTDDVRPFGGIDVATLQRYLNFHYSVSLDLFGAETSTNAANYFAAGLKGRFQEERRDDDHRLHGATREVPTVGRRRDRRRREAPALSALNETLRDDYVADCQKGVDRWNRTLAEVGARAAAAPRRVQPGGRHVRRSPRQPGRARSSSEAEWARGVDAWLPTDDDRAHVESLMRRCTEPGKMAGWIAPPSTGIHAKPVDFDYVRMLIVRRMGAAMTATTRPRGCSTATSTPDAAAAWRSVVRATSTTYARCPRRASGGPSTLLATSTSHGRAGAARAQRRAGLPGLVPRLLRAGVVPVPLSTMLTAADLAAIVGRRRSRMSLVSRREYADRRGAHRRDDRSLRHVVVAGAPASAAPARDRRMWSDSPTPDEAPVAADGRLPAFWLYSSGTTGRPEGRHAPPRQPAGDRRDLRRECSTSAPDDRCLSVAKLFFAYGLGQLADVPARRRREQRSQPATADARRASLALVRAEQPTLFFASPGFVAAPARHRRARLDAFASVRATVTAGEALPADLQRRFTERFGHPVLDGIGTTEALHIFLSNRRRPATWQQRTSRTGLSGTSVWR